MIDHYVLYEPTRNVAEVVAISGKDGDITRLAWVAPSAPNKRFNLYRRFQAKRQLHRFPNSDFYFVHYDAARDCMDFTQSYLLTELC